MISIFDDKIKGIIESNDRLILPKFKYCSEAIFKASYIVASDVKCEGKITALFDLTVLGNIEASDLEVKGRFVCTGRCDIRGTVIVQNDIWVEDIQAGSIETRDKIVAQEIDVGTVKADGNIVVGKILAVEKLAQSAMNILCGETAYGSGKVAAHAVITGEPIDLDEGEEAVIAPYSYTPTTADTVCTVAAEVDLIAQRNALFASSENWPAYLDLLDKSAFCEEDKSRFKRWCGTLSEAEIFTRHETEHYNNLALLIWVIEIANSYYFKDWLFTSSLLTDLNKYFAKLVRRDKSKVICSIKNYREWLQALEVLRIYGESMDKMVYNVAFELIVSNLGLKAKFVSERLDEKGWKANG